MHAKICKVNDSRIVDYVNRTRSGRTQEFYLGRDARDWDRYKAEGGGRNHNVEMHLKADTIRIEPPEKHYFAELIDGEWWWVNGCGECNGKPRGFDTYIECDKHNVCRCCSNPRAEITETPWGGISGWICVPCADAEHNREKSKALAAMPDEEDFDSWDYYNLDEIKCPYCDYEFSDSFESADDNEEAHECPRCDNEFKVTAVHSLAFDCERL